MPGTWTTAPVTTLCTNCPGWVLIVKGARMLRVDIAGVQRRLFLCEACGRRWERSQTAADQADAEPGSFDGPAA